MDPRNKILEGFLKRLQDLDSKVNDDKVDDGVMDELNKIINGISKEMEISGVKNNLTPVLKFKNLSNNPDPSFAHEGDSGFDLRAHVTQTDPPYLSIVPGKFAVIPTGLYFEVEKGLEIQVRPRSGLAAKFGITIVNTPGTIDSHYRGEVKIILANLGETLFQINNGDRIAQGVVCPIYGEGKLVMSKVDKLSDTVRNDGGFGSSGVK